LLLTSAAKAIWPLIAVDELCHSRLFTCFCWCSLQQTLLASADAAEPCTNHGPAATALSRMLLACQCCRTVCSLCVLR
jgi:hypothetical protein